MIKLYQHLLSFCDYCFENKEVIILQIYKSDEKLHQTIEVLAYEYENDYIIFKSNNLEEYLIMIDGTCLYIRKEPISAVNYTNFPREKQWGKKILFEIVDSLHGHEVLFTIGTKNETLLQNYIKEFLNNDLIGIKKV